MKLFYLNATKREHPHSKNNYHIKQIMLSEVANVSVKTTIEEVCALKRLPHTECCQSFLSSCGTDSSSYENRRSAVVVIYIGNLNRSWRCLGLSQPYCLQRHPHEQQLKPTITILHLSLQVVITVNSKLLAAQQTVSNTVVTCSFDTHVSYSFGIQAWSTSPS